PKDWIDKFKGKFDLGWDRYREETFVRQKKLGVIPQDAKLTPRPESLPAGDSLTADPKQLYAHMSGGFAAYGATCDRHTGRVVDAVNKSWTLTADLEIPESGAEGMIITHGGLVGGYGLYVREGKPTFVYNYLELERPTITGKDALPKGKVKLVI